MKQKDVLYIRVENSSHKISIGKQTTAYQSKQESSDFFEG